MDAPQTATAEPRSPWLFPNKVNGQKNGEEKSREHMGRDDEARQKKDIYVPCVRTIHVRCTKGTFSTGTLTRSAVHALYVAGERIFHEVQQYRTYVRGFTYITVAPVMKC